MSERRCARESVAGTLQEANGFFNLANSQNFTSHNASKATQADVNLAWFKSGWLGTHNFKFGYQLNHLTNDIAQHYNVPLVQYFVGQGSTYTPFSPAGIANCAPFVTLYGACTGQYGYINVLDYGSGGTGDKQQQFVLCSGLVVDYAKV